MALTELPIAAPRALPKSKAILLTVVNLIVKS
jgi:hypothetical protein